MSILPVKNTRDIPDCSLYNFCRDTALEISRKIHYKEVRTPIIEEADLFLKAVPPEDKIQLRNELFTILGNLVLRPEGTSGIMRMVIDRKLHENPHLPLKFSYCGPMFRKKHRGAWHWSEFTQFGVEVVGSHQCEYDAEVISLGAYILNEMGIEDVIVLLNFVPCAKCMVTYGELLHEYLSHHVKELCDKCVAQYAAYRHPLKVLSCQVPKCRTVLDAGPLILDHLCNLCISKYSTIKALLMKFNVPYINAKSGLRGLSRYSGGVVFKYLANSLPESTMHRILGGGGRYDELSMQISNQKIPAVGMALNIDMIITALGNQLVVGKEKQAVGP